MILHGRQLNLTQTAPSKQQHDCVLSYLLVCGGHASFAMHACVRVCARLCARAHVRSCLAQDMFKVRKKKGEEEEDSLTQPSSSAPAILISTALSTSTPEGGSNQRA